VRFWDVIREVSIEPIRREADRVFVLALAGDREAVEAARRALAGDPPPADADPYLLCASPPYDEDTESRLRHADLLVSLPGGPGLTDLRPAETIQVESAAGLAERLFERRPDLRVPLARRFPLLRPLAAEQVVRDVSRVNAEFAAVSAVGQSIPILAPLFPAVMGADVLLLTKNQVFMAFRLAALYGEDLKVRNRLREALPIIGGALGWRTLARQLAGIVPGALGLPIRAGIAYSGTYAAGKGVQMVFDSGRRPTRAEMAAWTRSGLEMGREVVASLRRRGPRSEEIQALARPTEVDPEPAPADSPGEAEARPAPDP